MKAAFAILVCCLVALLSESRADRLPVLEPSDLHYTMCYEELKVNRDLSYNDRTEEERKREECIELCVLKKRAFLQPGDDIFDENVYYRQLPKQPPQDKWDRALVKFNDCKDKERENPCQFILCILRISEREDYS